MARLSGPIRHTVRTARSRFAGSQSRPPTDELHYDSSSGCRRIRLPDPFDYHGPRSSRRRSLTPTHRPFGMTSAHVHFPTAGATCSSRSRDDGSSCCSGTPVLPRSRALRTVHSPRRMPFFPSGARPAVKLHDCIESNSLKSSTHSDTVFPGAGSTPGFRAS